MMATCTPRWGEGEGGGVIGITVLCNNQYTLLFRHLIIGACEHVTSHFYFIAIFTHQL